jgi:hypothetical protein
MVGVLRVGAATITALLLVAPSIAQTQGSAARPAESTNAAAVAPPPPLFNRAPLAEKPYAELPLGAIKPRGWLLDEMRRMAAGMSGRLDEWYPEVCGPRNAWLGGDGDTWERGPYWIDGLYPLAALTGDFALRAKAMQWINWTLANQRNDGDLGPRVTPDAERRQPAPAGAQVFAPDDWWPRMVMLKVLQQHYAATGDPRVVEALRRYFRHQLETLPKNRLDFRTFWATQRGADNLQVVLWFYNLTGEDWLLELADLIHEQTIPATDWFLDRGKLMLQGDRDGAMHCVNLAQCMKGPLVRWQQDRDSRRLAAVDRAFADVELLHGLPHGLYGADELMHGNDFDRGSELCTAVEMMFSLESMLEITGNVAFADRLEQIAFNVLPTQVTDDYRARQYFQQANQPIVSYGDHGFYNDGGDRNVFGLLQGYPCCTCNLHQGWPKFAQHTWMATNDGGLAALVYSPTHVSMPIDDQGAQVSIVEETGYPFHETVTFTVATPRAHEFPLHLRIPGWCQGATLVVNGRPTGGALPAGAIHVVKRTWADGDKVELRLPMPLRRGNWRERAVSISRGPLLFALRIEEDWNEVKQPAPAEVPEGGMHRGYFEVRPKSPWNYALEEQRLRELDASFPVEVADAIPDNPWTLDGAPVTIHARGVRLPTWTLNRGYSATPPLSPVARPAAAQVEDIRLIPYGATTLRICGFPWVAAERR